jgi:hypothetical protein
VFSVEDCRYSWFGSCVTGGALAQASGQHYRCAILGIRFTGCLFKVLYDVFVISCILLPRCLLKVLNGRQNVQLVHDEASCTTQFVRLY